VKVLVVKFNKKTITLHKIDRH